MMMLGSILIVTGICALCVQARKRWREMISQGESSHSASEGAPWAAPQAQETNRRASASEGAPRAAPQAQAKADPEPSPHKTQRCSVLPSLRQRRASQGSASSGSRDQYGRGAEEQEQGTARAELQQPEAPETTAARAAQNTAQPQRDKNDPSATLEPTVYYTRDGLKTGIFHINKHCSHLCTANKVHEKTLDFARSRRHRSCKGCGHGKLA